MGGPPFLHCVVVVSVEHSCVSNGSTVVCVEGEICGSLWKSYCPVCLPMLLLASSLERSDLWITQVCILMTVSVMAHCNR